MYPDYQGLQNFEKQQLVLEQSDTNLPCTPAHATSVCSPAEVTTHRKINLDHYPQSPETQRNFRCMLCYNRVNNNRVKTTISNSPITGWGN